MFCKRPFDKIDIFEDGSVYACCPDWQPKKIGQFPEQSLAEILESKEYQEVKESVNNGDFRFCDKNKCPFLSSKKGPIIQSSEQSDKKINEIISNKKVSIKCSYDVSCNLSCPSCRSELIVHKKGSSSYVKAKKIQQRLIDSLDLISDLHITGSGDPFGSPLYMELLDEVKNLKQNNLSLHFYTNAQLLTPSLWNKLGPVSHRIKSINISIDGLSNETYEENRRGGKLHRLLKNLDFISEIKTKNRNIYLEFNMTVQENNFHEMHKLVQLAEKTKADEVAFNSLQNWGHYSNQDYLKRSIINEEHSRHLELKEYLKNSIFKKSIVDLGNFSQFLDRN